MRGEGEGRVEKGGGVGWEGKLTWNLSAGKLFSSNIYPVKKSLFTLGILGLDFIYKLLYISLNIFVINL